MMPVSDQQDTVDYKQKYKTLKRKLKFLIYEQECFMEELRKAQRKLLKVARDRSFLLDRLLQYEKVDDSSSDSDATASSDSDAEGQKDGSSKRKKSQHLTPMTIFGEASAMLGGMAFGNMMSQQQTVPPPPYPGNQQSEVAVGQFTVAAATAASVVATATPQDSASSEPPKKKAKKKVPKASVAPGSQAGKAAVAGQPGSKEPGQMTREELERHLESRMEFKQHYMRIEKAPSALPMEIFSNENSNPDSEGTGEGGDDKDLVIDIPE